MDEKTKALIAIGASMSAHCQPCVTYHVTKARELGIGDELILEAVAVGQMVDAGRGRRCAISSKTSWRSRRMRQGVAPKKGGS